MAGKSKWGKKETQCGTQKEEVSDSKAGRTQLVNRRRKHPDKSNIKLEIVDREGDTQKQKRGRRERTGRKSLRKRPFNSEKECAL